MSRSTRLKKTRSGLKDQICFLQASLVQGSVVYWSFFPTKNVKFGPLYSVIWGFLGFFWYHDEKDVKSSEKVQKSKKVPQIEKNWSRQDKRIAQK